MFGNRTLNRHAALMNRMAETLGIDLEEALRRGKISSAEWRDALVDCVGCDDPASCVHWLAEHGAPEDRLKQPAEEHAPGFCNNRLMMDRLHNALAAAGDGTQPGAAASTRE